MKRLLVFVMIAIVATGAFAEGLAIGVGHNSSEGVFIEVEIKKFRVGTYFNAGWGNLNGTALTNYHSVHANLVAKSFGLALSADIYETEMASFFAGLDARFLTVKTNVEILQTRYYEMEDEFLVSDYLNTLTISSVASTRGVSFYPHLGAEVIFDFFFIRGKSGVKVFMLGLDGKMESSRYDEYQNETRKDRVDMRLMTPAIFWKVGWDAEFGVRIPIGSGAKR